MSNKTYIGIDNGITGSIGIIHSDNYLQEEYIKTPTIIMQDYTKAKKNITRIKVKELSMIIKNIQSIRIEEGKILAILERPLVNSMRFKATISAVRCLESQLSILESLGIPYMFIDSKEWQKEVLPLPAIKKKENETAKEKKERKQERQRQLKSLSRDIGIRLFPHLKEQILKQKDADGILIAEWARRNNL